MIKHFRVPLGLARKLEEQGVELLPVLRRAFLPFDLFSQSRVLLTTDQLFAFWRAIGEVSKDASIGLELGTETRLERFHPSGLAAVSTGSFRAAVEHLARYKRLTCPEEILHEETDREWTISFRWLFAVDQEPQVLSDYCFAWLQTIARHGSGVRISPLRIEVVQPRTYAKTMSKHFGCPVLTGASRNAIVFKAADSRRPFITRNDDLLTLLAPQFDQEIRERESPNSFTDLVRDAISQRLAGNRPGVEDIARDLHMSGRTLQRRLQETGTSFQHVLDEARHGLARYYLSNSVLELNEAAYLLGYEDVNSFVRAFRSWEGVPPGLWRETRRTITIQ